MAQFALGDVVRKYSGGDGVVRAIFTTNDGELTYAVEKEGEHSISWTRPSYRTRGSRS